MFAAVIYDWDHLPAQHRQEVLAELLAGRASHRVAVHGYKLEENQVAALRGQDVAVYRSLQPEVFWLLRLAVSQGRARTPPGCPQEADADSGARLARRLEELRQERSDRSRLTTP